MNIGGSGDPAVHHPESVDLSRIGEGHRCRSGCHGKPDGIGVPDLVEGPSDGSTRDLLDHLSVLPGRDELGPPRRAPPGAPPPAGGGPPPAPPRGAPEPPPPEPVGLDSPLSRHDEPGPA